SRSMVVARNFMRRLPENEVRHWHQSSLTQTHALLFPSTINCDAASPSCRLKRNSSVHWETSCRLGTRQERLDGRDAGNCGPDAARPVERPLKCASSELIAIRRLKVFEDF